VKSGQETSNEKGEKDHQIQSKGLPDLDAKPGDAAEELSSLDKGPYGVYPENFVYAAHEFIVVPGPSEDAGTEWKTEADKALNRISSLKCHL
jgi:hypothetical protein